MIIVILLAVVTTVRGTNEVCPGGSFTCPDYATCCQLADLSYGCCPMQKAVCCDDHIHCCPENTKCMAGTCVQLNGANVTSLKLSPKTKDTQCFGSHYKCPDDTTCCKGFQRGTYGCCALENAVCCEDGHHCCPENTVCVVESQNCVNNGIISKMYDFRKSNMLGSSKYTKLIKSNNVSSVICPDFSSQCPNNYTCCQLPSGEWGCCPFPKATCCKDHLHCCPQNMKCDNTSSACFQGLMSIPSSLKMLAEPVNAGLVCPDNITCAESMTCCRTIRQHFACCPYSDAVCCSDGAHCCPNGYICDEVQKQCVLKQKSQFKSFFLNI